MVSFADGIDAETATGTPYFYVTDMEMSQIGMIIFNIFKKQVLYTHILYF